MAMSLAQRRALAIVPKFTGLCSMVGSALIVADIVRHPQKRKQTFSRIMLVMSCFDFVTSFMYALSTWPIPAGSGPLWAAGTTGTCTLQGFFIQLSLAAPLYNLCLAVHYLLVIKHGWDDVKLARAERLVHPAIIVIAVGIAVAGLPLNIYNDANVWCWIADNERMSNPDHAHKVYRWVFYYVELWSIIVVVSVVMLMVVVDLTKTEARTAALSSWAGQNTKNAMYSAVKRQSLYYVLAFYLTWTFPTTLRILQTIEVTPPYAIFLCVVIFTPLQGFLNFIIYMRPRYLKRHRKKAAKKRAERITTELENKTEQEMNDDAEVALAEANRLHAGDVTNVDTGVALVSEGKEEEKEEEKGE